MALIGILINVSRVGCFFLTTQLAIACTRLRADSDCPYEIRALRRLEHTASPQVSPHLGLLYPLLPNIKKCRDPLLSQATIILSMHCTSETPFQPSCKPPSPVRRSCWYWCTSFSGLHRAKSCHNLNTFRLCDPPGSLSRETQTSWYT